jgi:hypothetical protein
MDDAKKEARRKLLAEIEGSWDSPKPGAVTGEPVQPPTPEMQAALDAAADRLVESLDPPPISVPSMDELDSGWEGDEEEEEEEEEEEPEPELPDEKLDPVAYAAAKKARDERMEARRERKRVKAEAKKARRKARIDAAKVKQKGKSKKARPPGVAQAAKVAKAKARADLVAKSRAAQGQDDTDDGEAAADDERIEAAAPSRARAKAPPSRPMAKTSMLSSTNTWMLGIAIAIFIAAAIFVAVIAR